MGNRQKEKMKGQIFGFFFSPYFCYQSYQSFGWSYDANFNMNDLDFAAQSALFLLLFRLYYIWQLQHFHTIRQLSRSNMLSCSIKNNRLLRIGTSQWCSEQMTDFIVSLGGFKSLRWRIFIFLSN